MDANTVQAKTITLPLWIVYQKTVQQWEPRAAFVGKSECAAWSNENLGSVPARDMTVYHATVYTSQIPQCVIDVKNSEFTTVINGTVLNVVDLNDLPSLLSMVEHVTGMLSEFRTFQEMAKTAPEDWIRFRAMLRALTEDELLLAPKHHR